MEQKLFVDKLKERDRNALNELVVQNQELVLRTCMGYLHNREDAADLTQEVFVKAISRIEQFKGDSKLSSWLVSIAINLSINYLRDNKKYRNNIDVDELKDISADSQTTNYKEIKKAIKRASVKLPEKQYKVFVLFSYLDMSYAEIAEVTGYTLSSVESLLFRGRRKLRELLGDFYKDYKESLQVL